MTLIDAKNLRPEDRKIFDDSPKRSISMPRTDATGKVVHDVKEDRG